MKQLSILSIALFALLTFSLKGATDKYRLIINNNPATTITVAWNQISGNNPIVYYGTEDFGQNHQSYPLQKSVDRTENFRGMDNQFARIENLEANTAYYFVIRDSEGVSERFWFKTAPDDTSRLSFVAGGDSRNNQLPRQKANLLVSKLKPHAILFGGDMTSSDNSYQWQAWFEDWQLTTANDGRMFPIVAARGNHEQPRTINKLFDTPNDNSYYAITFGDNFVRSYTLNTEISVYGYQSEWLETDLNEHPDVHWKIAQYHKPMRPHTAGKSEGIGVYNAWAQLFYDHAMRLIVECDSHVNKTTFPIKPDTGNNSEEGFAIDEERGTVYTGEGCWGAPLRDCDDDKSWTRGSGSFNQIKLMFISNEEIELRTIKVANAEAVGEVSNEDPFTLPENLDVWKTPNNEDVIYIYPLEVTPKADFQFSETMPNEFVDFNSIQIDVDMIDPANGIASIVYKAINLSSDEEIDLATVNSEPYSLTVTLPESGQYEIYATAITIDEMETKISKIINVGEFTVDKSFRIRSGNNDIEEGETSGYMYTSSSDLELGYDSYNDQFYQRVGVRFTELSIPKGAAIQSCKLRFTSKKDRDITAETTISIENSVNSAAFNEVEFNLSNREYMSEQTVWTIPAWQKYDCAENTTSPELAPLVQNLINNEAWSMGNTITLMLQPSGPSLESEDNKRYPYSFDGNAERAPELLVTYYYKVENGVGVDKTIHKQHVSILPNPSSTLFYMTFPEKTEKIYTAYVYSSTGNQVYKKEIELGTKKLEINLDSNPIGIYFLNVLDPSNNLIIRKKLIKE